jgi:uncharacterized repeat protein (TIGR01451 family)
VNYVPVLSIAKDGPARADVGDTVVYSLTVSNDAVLGTGSPIQNVSVIDDLAGPAALQSGDDGDGLLEVGESWVYTASYTIQPTDRDPLVNTAVVTGQDTQGAAAFEARDSHSTAVDYAPALSLNKQGPATARVGESVVYRLTVTHDAALGDGSPVRGVSVVDDVAGAATLDSGDDGDGLLELGERWVYTARYTVRNTDPDPLVNTAVASGTDQDGEPVPEAVDTHWTAIDYAPALALAKDGPRAAKPGETIVYTLTVTHDAARGDGSPVYGISLRDDLAGGATYLSGDDGDELLEVGESWTYTASYTIQVTDPDPLVNVATVTGRDLDRETVPEASDQHAVATGERLLLFMPLLLQGP